MKNRRSLTERLGTQKALLGFMQTQPNLAIAEMTALCGYDFLFVDCEHGLFSEKDILETAQVLGATETAAVVRVRGHDLAAIGRYLDLGVDALVVPNVMTAEQARALALAMHYPPKGTRGFAAPVHRVTGYGRDTSAHLEDPCAGQSLLVILESALGIANAQAILAVEGIDGAIIGPSDLSADLGAVGDYSRPEFSQAFTHVEQVAKTSGKIIGTAPHAGAPADALISRGHRLLIIGADMPLIREAMNDQVTKARAALLAGSTSVT